jgi:hypothetical protein
MRLRLARALELRRCSGDENGQETAWHPSWKQVARLLTSGACAPAESKRLHGRLPSGAAGQNTLLRGEVGVALHSFALPLTSRPHIHEVCLKYGQVA